VKPCHITYPHACPDEAVWEVTLKSGVKWCLCSSHRQAVEERTAVAEVQRLSSTEEKGVNRS
jgi:uncharacterized protein (DUF2237 family)